MTHAMITQAAPKLLLRADAGNTVGVGHVMRSIALGQAWRRRGGSVVLVTAELPDRLRRRLRDERFAVWRIDARPGGPGDCHLMGLIAERIRPDWIAMDGYAFDATYQKAMRQHASRVLVVDDFAHAECYTCDVILNQNLNADPSLYVRRDSGTRLLLGPRYALLRAEFSDLLPPSESRTGSGRRVLVTFGGSDPHNMTQRVLESLTLVDDLPLDIVVLLGPENNRHRCLSGLAARMRHAVRLVHDPLDVATLMRDTDLAISAAGSTCWELSYLGVPQILIITADNQQAIARQLAERGGQRSLGWCADWQAHKLAHSVRDVLRNKNQRDAMAHAARKLVDGRGAGRVVDVLWRGRAA